MSSELQRFNGQNKLALWAQRVTDCRNSGLTVKAWCAANEICEQTYYRWQRRIYAMAQAEQAQRFADITPPSKSTSGSIAVVVRSGNIEAEVHNGADAATVEVVLRVLRSC